MLPKEGRRYLFFLIAVALFCVLSLVFVCALDSGGPVYVLCHTLDENYNCVDPGDYFVLGNLSDTNIIYFKIFEGNGNYSVKLMDLDRGPFDDKGNAVELAPSSPIDDNGVAEFSIPGVGEYLLVFRDNSSECNSTLNYDYSDSNSSDSVPPNLEEFDACLRYIGFSVSEDAESVDSFFSSYSLDEMASDSIFSDMGSSFREMPLFGLSSGPYVPSYLNKKIIPLPPTFGNVAMQFPPFFLKG